MSVFDWVSGRVFKFVHGNNLVYNTCWEDPRLDRVALQIQPSDNILVITSAGCNALDYALCGPNHVHAVDMNPRQNALLDLKIAGIKSLDFEDFFRLFGYGFHPDARRLYQRRMRPVMPAWSQAWWDRWIKFFDNKARPFYFRGTSGAFARLIKVYTDRVIRVRPHIDAILEAKSLPEQREIYEKHLKEKFWSRPMRFAMNRDTTLSMVGVPKAQRRQVESQYNGGVVKFVQDSVEAVFCKLPLADNYFWRVYMKGEYSRSCCPEYLRAENFERLKGGLIERVSTHTNSVQGFLDNHEGRISKYVLLDHMDWLSDKFFPLLELEWQAILRRAAPTTRIIWRSGGLKTDFIDRVNVATNGHIGKLPELLKFNPELAAELHEKDRVHTYGSFYIADFDNLIEIRMGFASDLKILYHLALKPVRGKDHAARMESFYAGQAEAYDDFRKRLLKGRQELWNLIPPPSGGTWLDMGGGTGANLDYFGPAIAGLQKIYVLDLSHSLLDVAKKRFAAKGWTNAETVEADATTFQPPTGPVDVVTFSYSLTMIPDWFAAIENALSVLKPGGTIGVVDFYVARKYPAGGLARHSWFTRTFWPTWFAMDNVYPSPDHVPFLHRHFDVLQFEEHRAKVPYIPFARMPYYLFVGRKR